MKIIISAGGTGGHMIPAQQLSQKLKDHEIYFVAKGLDQNRNFQKKTTNITIYLVAQLIKKEKFHLVSSFLKVFCKAFG